MKKPSQKTGVEKGFIVDRLKILKLLEPGNLSSASIHQYFIAYGM